jgi:hypothetical protein
MTQRFDPSLINLLTTGNASAAATNGPSDVASLVDEAVCRAIDWIAGGDHRSARVCVENTKDRTWILLDVYTPQGGDVTYAARTNDMDLMCGAPPSFHVDNTDPAVVHEASAQFLTAKYDGQDIRILVFRTEGSSSEPVEEATSASGTFRELAEFPSL